MTCVESEGTENLFRMENLELIHSKRVDVLGLGHVESIQTSVSKTSNTLAHHPP